MKSRIVILSAILCMSLAGCAGGVKPKESNISQAVSTAAAESEENAASSEEASVESSSKAATEATEASEEASEDMGGSSQIDISGCDTFTQIVDRKLESGMGYANVNIGGIDVLLVASGCYDNGDGNMAAIDASVYMYGDDGAIKYVGGVEAGGTAYPLAVKDGKLFVGGNHFMGKYTIDKDKLTAAEKAYEEFDEDGKATYFYESAEEDLSGETSDDSILPSMYDEYAEAEVVGFSVVEK